MLQAFRKILINANMRNHETFSERHLEGPTKVAHSHSKAYKKCALQKILQKLANAADRAHVSSDDLIKSVT